MRHYNLISYFFDVVKCAAQLKARSFDCSMSMAVETPTGLTSLPRALDVVLFVYGNRFYVTLLPTNPAT